MARVVPPKSADISSSLTLVSSWNGKVGSVLVADNPCGRMGISALYLAEAIRNGGGDPILTMSCRDRNRIALGSIALAAAAASLNTVLCVSGDYPRFGDHPQAAAVYDLDSVQLISMLKDMENGRDIAGNPLSSSLSFLVGGAVCPTADPLGPQLMKTRKKVKAGADFLITLPVFTAEQPASFFEAAGDVGVKIVVGVLLPSYQEIQAYRDGSIPGTFIPGDLVEQWRSLSEEEFLSASRAHVKKLISDFRSSGTVAGVCISASGRESEIAEML